MRKTLRAYLAQQDVADGIVYQVVLAADEAFTNAVTHAGSDDVIRVSACVSADAALVEVRDAGGGFSPAASDPNDGPGRAAAERPGGLPDRAPDG